MRLSRKQPAKRAFFNHHKIKVSMLRISYILSFLLLISMQSCHLLLPSPSPQTDNDEGLTGTALATSYISRFKDIAIAERKRTGVPASIKLAQAILESGYGRSTLAQKANNHFGIKCGGDWTGKTYRHRSSCYRAYSSADDSFRQHSDFLAGRSHYASLFKLKVTDYKGWAKGLRKAGYATDPSYPSKLIELIERYKLYRYDQ
jgi:flagellum-specific peptidoglycan hydrolase FlgJ